MHDVPLSIEVILFKLIIYILVIRITTYANNSKIKKVKKRVGVGCRCQFLQDFHSAINHILILNFGA